MSHTTGSLSEAGAAASRVSDAPSWLTMPRVATTILATEIISLIAFPAWRASSTGLMLLGASLPLTIWLMLRMIVIEKVLTVPKSPPSIMTDPHWEAFRFEGWGGTTLTGRHLRADGGSSDLLLYLHGYGSDLSNGESRIQHLSKLGLDVVGMDMRGHGGCELRHDWTLLKAVADMEGLLESVIGRYEDPPKRFWIHGHSVGGFIGLRLASHPSGWWADRLAGIVLESPASSFPLVIESLIHPSMQPLRGWIRQVLRREFERIHPDLSIRYATAAVPHIGMPEVPMLVLQAAADSRLGLAHYELLMQHIDPDLCTAHLLDGHEHTTSMDSTERRRCLERWLQPRLASRKEG